MSKFNLFEQNEELIDALSQSIVDCLQEDINQLGRAIFAVSGGSSPKKLYEKLSRMDMDWSKLTVVLVDERFVDINHPDSNEAMIKTHLLKGNASSAQFIAWSSQSENISDAVIEAKSVFEQLDAPFSVVLLGMGTDGHTASWFADAPEYECLIDHEQPPSVGAAHPVNAPHARLTLNLSSVMQSKKLFLQINGSEKWSVLHQAINKEHDSVLPISELLHETSPLEIFWAAS